MAHPRRFDVRRRDRLALRRHILHRWRLVRGRTGHLLRPHLQVPAPSRSPQPLRRRRDQGREALDLVAALRSDRLRRGADRGRHRGLARRQAGHPAARRDDPRDRAAVGVDVRPSRTRPPAGYARRRRHRQRAARPQRYDVRVRAHVAGRRSQLLDPGVPPETGRRARPHDQGVVPPDQDRHLRHRLRRDVRSRARAHAGGAAHRIG